MRVGIALAAMMLGTAASAQDMDSVTWHLRGIDLFGLHSLPRETVIAELPWKVGDTVRAADKPARERWCAETQTKYKFLQASCALILMQPDNAYLSIDIVEGGDGSRIPHPANRWDPKLVLAPQLKADYTELDQKIDQKFAAGVRVHDVTEGLDHVDYQDADLHALAAKLTTKIPPYRDHLLKIVTHGGESSDRVASAVLLNWAGNPADSAAKVYPLLDDPDPMVRNYISRFLIKWAPRIKEPKKKTALIHFVAAQLDLPSFGDRNKAVFVLRELADADPSTRPEIAGAACPQLRKIANLSSAPNVGGEARELLAELSPTVPTDAACQPS